MRVRSTRQLVLGTLLLTFLLGACDSADTGSVDTPASTGDTTLVAAPAPVAAGDTSQVVAIAGRDSTGAAPTAAPVAGGRTTLDRVFTVQQASRGQNQFDQICVECHNPDYFTGEKFREWNTKSLGEIYEFASTMMPANAPGTLSPQQYVDIISYLLRQNGYPAGSQELPADPAVLNAIRITLLPH